MTRRRIAAIAGIALGLFLAYFGYLAWRVWSAAHLDEAQRADVIIVFGAAEYRGRPSPVLRARLDHALELYQQGTAPRIITTGGPGGDPNFTEGGVERNYLVAHGVPPENVTTEAESTSTTETVIAVAEIMLRDNLRTCVVVSDGYHLFRIKRQLEQMGIRVFGSPRQERGEMPFWSRLRVTLREVFGYMLWQLHIRM